MTFTEWLELGYKNSWCGPVICSTHDGTPLSESEDAEFTEGFDPCISMIRIYESPVHRVEVEKAHSPSVWRASNAGLTS